ncbi:MAG: M23 family metallopeptidase [Candidatus Woesearchaeota archaeon]
MHINRKGHWLVFFLTIGSLIIFAFLYATLYKKDTQLTKYIGFEQIRMLDTYAQGEKALYFIDVASKYAIYDAAVKLGENGGLWGSSCGLADGFQAWRDRAQECYPNSRDALINFQKAYSDSLIKYLNSYPEGSLPVGKYYSIIAWNNDKTTSVVGTTKESIAIIPPGSIEASIDASKGFAYPIQKNGGIKADKFFVTSCFGIRILNGEQDSHPGVDFGHPEGTPIYAVEEGIVEDVSYDCKSRCEGLIGEDKWGPSCYCGSGYGNYVKIKHSNFETVYAHLKEIFVKEGDSVSKGQQIGTEGSTGKSTGPHLHFELRIKGNAVNPLCVYDTNSGNFVFSDGGDGSCERTMQCSYVVTASSTGTSADESTFKAGDLSYYVNPSFKASAEYSFQIYDILSEKAKTIVKACSKKSYDERAQCVMSKSKELSDSEVELSVCSQKKFKFGEEAIITLLRSIEEECLDGDGCYCYTDLLNIPAIEVPDGTYDFEVSNGFLKAKVCTSSNCISSTRLVFLSDNYDDASYNLGFPTTISTNYEIGITYRSGKIVSAQLRFEDSSGNMQVWDLSNLIIFKKRGIAGELFSMIVNKDAFENPDNHFKEYMSCGFSPDAFTFCAIDKTNKIPVYVPNKNKLSLENPTIKFALYI